MATTLAGLGWWLGYRSDSPCTALGAWTAMIELHANARLAYQAARLLRSQRRL